MATALWLSADPVADGALGVTDRVEGVRRLRREGHEVSLICGGSRDHRGVEGVPTVFLPTRYVPLLGWIWIWPRLIRVLRERGPRTDVVISDFAVLPPLMWWRDRRRRAGRPAPAVILDVRTAPVEAGRIRAGLQQWRFGATLRRFGRRVDAITTISEGLRSEVAKRSRLDPSSIAVWRSGCSWCDDTPAGGTETPRSSLLGQGRFMVVYHGSLSPGRGLFDAIAALDELRDDAPDMDLVLLGAGSAVPALREMATGRRLEDRVIFLDPIPHAQVRAVLSAAHLGLVPLPPRWEWQVSSPLKLMEYLCAGLPVVLTEIDPHRIVPSDAGFVFWAGAGSPGELAGALRLAYESRDRLAALGDEAARWARPRLGWEPQLAVVAALVERLAGGTDHDLVADPSLAGAPAAIR